VQELNGTRWEAAASATVGLYYRSLPSGRWINAGSVKTGVNGTFAWKPQIHKLGKFAWQARVKQTTVGSNEYKASDTAEKDSFLVDRTYITTGGIAGAVAYCCGMSSGSPSDQPRSGWDDSDPGIGGGFVNIRYDDPDRAELEAEYDARMRAKLGDQAVERMRRSLALSENPRQLTDGEKAVLRRAVAPLLRDMEATGQSLPDIREEAHHHCGEDAVCAWIWEPGERYGQGIEVWLHCPPTYQICYLAEQLQSWAGDVQVDPERRPWPGCPDHPGAHTLMPDTRDEVAVWRCPQTGHVIAEIGMLA
jgi:hypothetical protein